MVALPLIAAALSLQADAKVIHGHVWVGLRNVTSSPVDVCIESSFHDCGSGQVTSDICRTSGEFVTLPAGGAYAFLFSELPNDRTATLNVVRRQARTPSA